MTQCPRCTTSIPVDWGGLQCPSCKERLPIDTQRRVAILTPLAAKLGDETGKRSSIKSGTTESLSTSSDDRWDTPSDEGSTKNASVSAPIVRPVVRTTPVQSSMSTPPHGMPTPNSGLAPSAAGVSRSVERRSVASTLALGKLDLADAAKILSNHQQSGAVSPEPTTGPRAVQPTQSPAQGLPTPVPSSAPTQSPAKRPLAQTLSLGQKESAMLQASVSAAAVAGTQPPAPTTSPQQIVSTSEKTPENINTPPKVDEPISVQSPPSVPSSANVVMAPEQSPTVPASQSSVVVPAQSGVVVQKSSLGTNQQKAFIVGALLLLTVAAITIIRLTM